MKELILPMGVIMWSLALILSAFLGVFLSLKFSALGLLAFSAANLILCLACPIALRASKVKYPTGAGGLGFALCLSVLFVPFFGLILWKFVSPLQVAQLLFDFRQLAVVGNDVANLAAFTLDPSSVNFTKKMVHAIDLSQHHIFSLVLSKVFTYAYLPIIITAGTLSNIRYADYQIELKRTGRAIDFGKPTIVHIAIFCMLVLGIFWAAHTLSAAPHVYAEINHRYLNLATISIAVAGPLFAGVHFKCIELMCGYGGLNVTNNF